MGLFDGTIKTFASKLVQSFEHTSAEYRAAGASTDGNEKIRLLVIGEVCLIIALTIKRVAELE